MLTKGFLAGVLDANPSAVWYETFLSYTMILDGGQVWTQLSSIPPAGNLATAQTNASNNPTIIQNLSAAASAIRLTEILGTNSSTYAAYSTYNNRSTAIYRNWILPQLISQTSGAPSNGYAVQLYNGDPNAGGVVVSSSAGTTGTGNNKTVGWIFNYAAGMLLLAEDYRANITDPYIVGFRYIGNTASTPSGGATVALVADEAIAIGDLVRLALNGEPGLTAGRAVKAQANSLNGSEVVGVAVTAAAAQGNSFNIAQAGSRNVTFGSNPATTSNGVRVFLSDAAAGRGVLTPPTAAGSVVVEIGKLTGATGSAPTVSVLMGINQIVAL